MNAKCKKSAMRGTAGKWPKKWENFAKSRSVGCPDLWQQAGAHTSGSNAKATVANGDTASW